jgi:hypothetical protein
MVYILIRVQYKQVKPEDQRFMLLKFSPESALIIVILAACLIEMSQYFKWYLSYFDPFDFLAYISALLPVYLIDKRLANVMNERK